MQPDGEGVLATFRAPQALLPYVVAKGYVAVDGMSLTVVDTGPDWFSISFISHTRAVTNVRYYVPGRRVNLEVDVLGKYVENSWRTGPRRGNRELVKVCCGLP